MSDSHRRPVPPAPEAHNGAPAAEATLVAPPGVERQEVLMVLSLVIAKSLPSTARKEASHEHP